MYAAVSSDIRRRSRHFAKNYFLGKEKGSSVAGFLVPWSSTYFFLTSVSGPELFGLVWSAVRTVSPVGIDFWDVQNSIREKGGKKSNTRGHKINKLETELQGNCHSTVIEKKNRKETKSRTRERSRNRSRRRLSQNGFRG